MKKTLIALAVLAASGASFAQVTITGNYIFGYKSSTTSATATTAQVVTQALAGGNNGNVTGDSSGLGIDTSVITFQAAEDLGGGMSVSAEMGFDGLSRAGVAGGDSSVKLTTPVGRLTLQAYKTAEYLSGTFGVGGVGMDNKVFPARSFKDSIGFDTKLGPIIVSLAHQEQGTANGVAPAAALGLGIGAQGAQGAVGQRLNSISGTYIAGALFANLNYLQYDNRSAGLNTSYKDVIRTGATYDFGAAKVGGAYSLLTTMSGSTLADAAISVAVPLGALTLGANFATETSNGTVAMPAYGLAAGALDQTRTGFGVAATYALSKRTSVIANYASWLPYGVGNANRNSETNLLLSHSF